MIPRKRYTAAALIDVIEDREGYVMAALCMHEIVDCRRDEINELVGDLGAYGMREMSKILGAIAQINEEHISGFAKQQEDGQRCWEALGCSDFDWEYMEFVLDWFLETDTGMSALKGLAKTSMFHPAALGVLMYRAGADLCAWSLLRMEEVKNG